MNRDSSRALQLKNDGNERFLAGDYVGAESLYSKAIIADDKNPALFTNRAMARLKLRMWDSVVSDCEDCLRLQGDNMKANYYLTQAHLELRNYDEALHYALCAHQLCVQTNDRSMPQATALVLRCKKERWDDLEKKRERAGRQLQDDLLALLQRERDEQLASCTTDAERDEVEQEYNARVEQTGQVFNTAREKEDQRRVVPDWAIDEISFAIFVDPVMTKTGKSYERASIMEHLRRSQTDPLTREPLVASDLRPNLALKEACEEFLKENGWAVDW